MKSKKPLPGADSAENQPYLKVIHFGRLSSARRLTVRLNPREGKGGSGILSGQGQKEQDCCCADLGTSEFLQNELSAGL